jgi:uncharacterized protein
MDWTPGDMSSDIEDRRGDSGGGGGFQFGGGGLGIGGVVVLIIISLITGRNYIGSFLSGGGGAVQTQRAPVENGRPIDETPEEDRSAHLISFTLDDVQNFWTKKLAEQNIQFPRAKLVLFRDQTYSGCGTAESATGPFYCPLDQKVYIDLGFWDELRRLGGSTADFAQAYVIAHELGHHVQNVLGIEKQVRRQQQWNPSQQNELSVALELQADCFAGVWANSGEQRNLIHRDDIDEGIKAVGAVGDDHIQRMTRGTVSPERFTHGSSAQRIAWFRRGLEGGTIKSCNTFQSTGEDDNAQ